ncbi:MAG TPA: DUF4974 domain-containing protein [Tepidisphaeraceae bacterium]|nr:DUF4974 domain-containing protein [Tepidisphaeraceae bacterium]
MRSILLAVLLVCASVSAAPSQENSTSALINEALDKNVSLQLDGVLPDVLKTIESKTGVRIDAPDQVYDLLPWGEQTNIKAKIENQTLRAALTAITQKLGLYWELGQFDVSLKPMPALARLGRRATVSELQALDLLTTTPLGDHPDQMTVKALVDAIDKRLAQIKSPSLVTDLRAGDPADPQAGSIKLDAPINVRRDATLSEALQDMSRQTDATWYPWGKDIVIVPKQQQIRLQLDKTITARYNGQDISKVLDILSRRSGVPFQIEPGAFQRVPQEYRSIKLDLENATVRQVLDDIRGLTGLEYVVKPEGIYVWNQNPNPSPAAQGGAGDPVIAMLEADGGLQILLRVSDLPPDVVAYLAHKKDDEVARLRKRMKDEGFNPPATQPAPASQPVAKDKDL